MQWFRHKKINKGYFMMDAILRKMREADLVMVRDWRNREDVRKFMYTQHEISMKEHQNWWNNMSKRTDNVQLIFEYKGQACAVVSFSELSQNNKNASWAFYLGDSAKRGIGSLVEFEALEYAFNILNLHKLKCEVLALNDTVIKMHKKYGFKEEGYFIDEYLYDFDFIDIYRLATFNADWQKTKKIISTKLDRIWNK
jgi:UDP-4-amino-4,6-dideoxy-N-acetyl-beta-L-altrosamine N-acetyltransferase